MEDMITQEHLDKCYTKKVRGIGGFGQVDTFIILNHAGVPKEFPKQIAGKSALNELNEPEARREIYILKKLINEQNIVTLISYTKTSPTLILMECLNTDLGSFAKNRHFTQKDIFKISKDCLHALVSLRKHEIIHRDFKPGNLLIDFQGTDGANVQDLLIKLCDFGLSRIVNTEKMELGTMDLSMNRGTNGYMAPEITLLPRDDDSSGKYTHKVDIWGFGVTILFLVSKGQKPFIETYLRELQSEYTNIPRRNREIKSTVKNNVGEEFGDVSVIIGDVLKWLPEERKTAEECLTITEHYRTKNEFSTLQKKGKNQSASQSDSMHKSGEHHSSFELKLQEPTPTEGTCKIKRWPIIVCMSVFVLLCVIISIAITQYPEQSTPPPKVITCGGFTSLNETYFENVGYPSTFDSVGYCQATVTKSSNNVCQIRLFFKDMILAQPDSTDHICNDDKFIVSGGPPIPTICGTNTGQHMYVDMDLSSNSPVVLAVVTAGWSYHRTFSIFITQIECNSHEKAPHGCLQYFTGVTGQVSSFNYNYATGLQLSDTDYTICIRNERNFCGIQYTTCPDDTNEVSQAFSLTGGFPTLGSKVGSQCSSDWITILCATNSKDPTTQIPGSFFSSETSAETTVGGWGSNVKVTEGEGGGAEITGYSPVGGWGSNYMDIACVDRMCGEVFNSVITPSGSLNVPVYSYSSPFNIYVHTDSLEGSSSPPDVSNRGFCLHFEQQPCST